MACTKFEYVKKFESFQSLLPNCYIVIRIDGHSFHRFTSIHNFKKPNDRRALDLANLAAMKVMEEFQDIRIAYGQSDEYSFVFDKNCKIYKRRESKLVSLITSLFTANYVFNWSKYFSAVELQYLPSFDSRAVIYPSLENLRDYMSWRCADCHINNLYNTIFWCLVQDESSPKTVSEAQDILKDTDSGMKNEMLFSKFGINYNNIEEIYKKGTVLYRKNELLTKSDSNISRVKSVIKMDHVDIINDKFWKENPEIFKSA
ncbi:tRNA-histidine guanylyltransferase 1-like [Clydaea vesicula]|uniref:tRNA(His) guanylyltransferase n=1 Tax=Clydaea vesicula TaxID=447962 RepID=A0AAD5U7X7_9FUNG|nr:tRNA-histidine guanylyltransferase 1-like [Clydaea vesicula]KAJ3382816.1 tRNA-histidine guanylyltransferase 1-like [Lobulomyces angularis]